MYSRCPLCGQESTTGHSCYRKAPEILPQVIEFDEKGFTIGYKAERSEMLTRADMQTLIDDKNKRITELEAELQRLREALRTIRDDDWGSKHSYKVAQDALSGEE